jgi:hypothetical protein
MSWQNKCTHTVAGPRPAQPRDVPARGAKDTANNGNKSSITGGMPPLSVSSRASSSAASVRVMLVCCELEVVVVIAPALRGDVRRRWW